MANKCLYKTVVHYYQYQCIPQLDSELSMSTHAHAHAWMHAYIDTAQAQGASKSFAVRMEFFIESQSLQEIRGGEKSGNVEIGGERGEEGVRGGVGKGKEAEKN